MKIYEKPMATIEMLDVEDVITASTTLAVDSETKAAILEQVGADAGDNVLVFEW
jgi:hypothetical protein